MDLSLGFVLGSLLFLTPALALVAILRIQFPIHRTMSYLRQGLTMPAVALVVSVVINGSLFINYFRWSLSTSPLIWGSSLMSAFALSPLVGNHNGWLSTPSRAFMWFFEIETAQGGWRSVLALILDAHLRVLLVGVAFAAAVRGWIGSVERADAEDYRWATNQQTNWFTRLRHSRKKTEKEKSRFVLEYNVHKWWSPRLWTQYIREALYHPWAILTRHNRFREILMVDVLSEDDNLYSGMFTSWIPDGDETASAITLQFALRYFPREEIKGGTEAEKKAAEKKPRKTKFVANNGELMFPMDGVANLYFWEIRLGKVVLVNVQSESDLEYVKWCCALNEVRPGFFTKIGLEFTGDKTVELAQKFTDWIADYKMELKHVEGLPDSPAPKPKTA